MRIAVAWIVADIGSVAGAVGVRRQLRYCDRDSDHDRIDCSATVDCTSPAPLPHRDSYRLRSIGNVGPPRNRNSDRDSNRHGDRL